MGASQGTVLSLILFTRYTSDFTYNSTSCHLLKFSDDYAIVGCKGKEAEYRDVVDSSRRKTSLDLFPSRGWTWILCTWTANRTGRRSLMLYSRRARANSTFCRDSSHSMSVAPASNSALFCSTRLNIPLSLWITVPPLITITIITLTHRAAKGLKPQTYFQRNTDSCRLVPFILQLRVCVGLVFLACAFPDPHSIPVVMPTAIKIKKDAH